ncbi:hypothetical protein BLS_006352 [Venturia inaequalis]|uniref:Uncharacterized protein n=1 Tax=Venturia inaequalis TaxID=5025 RepID=A0A8H3UDV7_VENIN|nr:hypothetical protein BLS_006352 [Venturia inaequalis]RDI78918.1 2-oxoglutarate dehydrogenase [Venturia inaequalis]
MEDLMVAVTGFKSKAPALNAASPSKKTVVISLESDSEEEEGEVLSVSSIQHEDTTPAARASALDPSTTMTASGTPRSIYQMASRPNTYIQKTFRRKTRAAATAALKPLGDIIALKNRIEDGTLLCSCKQLYACEHCNDVIMFGEYVHCDICSGDGQFNICVACHDAGHRCYRDSGLNHTMIRRVITHDDDCNREDFCPECLGMGYRCDCGEDYIDKNFMQVADQKKFCWNKGNAKQKDQREKTDMPYSPVI